MLWVLSLSALVSFTRTSKHNQVARVPGAPLRRGAAALRREEEEGGEGWMGRVDKRCPIASFGQNLNSK